MRLAHYIGLLHRAEQELGRALREVGEGHSDEPDVRVICMKVAADCEDHAERLEPFARRYGEEAEDEPERLHSELFKGTRGGGLALLRDLHDLYLMACQCEVTWILVGQAAQGARDSDLLSVVQACEEETTLARKWLTTRMKAAAPQTLVVSA
jgi:hypothetical protein